MTQLWLSEDPGDGWPVRVALDHVPEGGRPVERYAVTPDPARARFLVPLATQVSAAASVSRYNGLRAPKLRASRALLGAGFRSGIAQRLLRSRLVVAIDRDTPDHMLTEYLPTRHLARALGVDLVAGISVRDPDPNLKPILQLFRVTDGAPAGFAKVGWNAATRTLVSREAAAMGLVRDAVPVRVPRVLHHGSWQGRVITVVEPLPQSVSRHTDPDRPLDPAIPLAIAESTGTFTKNLGDSTYWHELTGQARELSVSKLGDDLRTTAAAVAAAMEAVEASHGLTELRFARWHGDWTPWNVGWVGKELWVWDWEHSAPAVPLGFDLLNWRFQVAVAQRGLPLRTGVRDAFTSARDELPAIGVPGEVRELVAWLYLLEMFVRTCRLRAGGGGWHSQIFPEAILGVLGELRAAV
ncbi:phosphotransferase [Sinosporangium album]|nr:phosphotransferase [Sinosporangium album]